MSVRHRSGLVGEVRWANGPSAYGVYALCPDRRTVSLVRIGDQTVLSSQDLGSQPECAVTELHATVGSRELFVALRSGALAALTLDTLAVAATVNLGLTPMIAAGWFAGAGTPGDAGAYLQRAPGELVFVKASSRAITHAIRLDLSRIATAVALSASTANSPLANLVFLTDGNGRAALVRFSPVSGFQRIAAFPCPEVVNPRSQVGNPTATGVVAFYCADGSGGRTVTLTFPQSRLLSTPPYLAAVTPYTIPQRVPGAFGVLDDATFPLHPLSSVGGTADQFWHLPQLDPQTAGVVSSTVRDSGAVVTKSGDVWFQEAPPLLGYAIMRYLGPLVPFDPIGYKSATESFASNYVVPAGVTAVRLNVQLCAERMTYAGGTVLNGTIVEGGTPQFPDWDRYICRRYNSVGTLLKTYNLNWAASWVLDCPSVLTSQAVIPVDAGDVIAFEFTEVDGQTGTALSQLQSAIVTSRPLPGYVGGYESGCIVRLSPV